MLDRRRIRQLSRRESAALDERTPGSEAMFRRARRSAQRGGSCIAVVATDVPLSFAQLSRVARRAGLGVTRTGEALPRDDLLNLLASHRRLER
jgi:L-aminopeptidase/D-esterase-like protein